MRVVIIVEGGLVQEVYSDDAKTDLEIIDLDTDDADELGLINAGLKNLENDLLNDRLDRVY